MPLKDELDFINKYLDIERTRFGDRLQVSFVIEPDTLGASVPNFLLQPLVENALRHGIGPKVGGGRVEVRAHHNGEWLQLVVQDDGHGVPPDTLDAFNTGVGLSNTLSRLEHLYPGNHTFEFQTPPGRRAGGDDRHPVRGGCRARRGVAERRMNKIRALVVDDEPMARDRVLSLLQHEEDVEVVGECGDGTQAVTAIHNQAPDLVFLDVQMPGHNGFEVIEAVGAERMPTVIFVTAYDEYALKAFEVHALDYLLKPFGRDRFQQTLQHARAILERRRAGDLGRRLLALVNDIKTEPGPTRLDRLVVKSGGRVFFLRTDQIDWIEAAGNYVRLHLGEESHLFRETMNRMEARLDGRRFVRIHRSRIVNTERVKELQPWFNGEHVVILQNGTRLTLSRGYREKLQEQLKRGF